jgi:uncharacterized protein YgiM (DUF1202 family)
MKTVTLSKVIIFFFSFIFLNENIKAENKFINQTGTLISNLDIQKSMFKNDDDLKSGFQKYKYQGVFIENLKITDLLNEQYRKRLINELSNCESEDDPKAMSITFLTLLLMLRMEVLQDSDAFFILSELSKNEDMAYMGIELSSSYLDDLFYKSPLFYIQESQKYNTTRIMETIVSSGLRPLREDYFFERKGSISIKSGMILVFKENIDGLNDSNAKKKISSQKPIKGEFKLVNPSKHEKPIEYLYDIHPFLKDLTQDNLTADELKFYSERIYPLFDDFEIRNYHVRDKDGSVNIRKEPTTSSEIVGAAQNGDYVCYVPPYKPEPNWVHIEYKEISGYIHSSRLVRE